MMHEWSFSKLPPPHTVTEIQRASGASLTVSPFTLDPPESQRERINVNYLSFCNTYNTLRRLGLNGITCRLIPHKHFKIRNLRQFKKRTEKNFKCQLLFEFLPFEEFWLISCFLSCSRLFYSKCGLLWEKCQVAMKTVGEGLGVWLKLKTQCYLSFFIAGLISLSHLNKQVIRHTLNYQTFCIIIS